MITGVRVRRQAFDLADAETVWDRYQDHEFSVLDGNIYGASLETMRAFVQISVVRGRIVGDRDRGWRAGRANTKAAVL